MSYFLSRPPRILVGSFGRFCKPGRVLAEEGVSILLLDVDRDRHRRGLQFVDAVFLLRLAEESAQRVEQLLQVGDRNEAENLKAQTVGAGGEAPRLGLVEPGQTLSLREQGDHAFQVLGNVWVVRQLADKVDVVEIFW